jgi:hypothetical protein
VAAISNERQLEYVTARFDLVQHILWCFWLVAVILQRKVATSCCISSGTTIWRRFTPKDFVHIFNGKF